MDPPTPFPATSGTAVRAFPKLAVRRLLAELPAAEPRPGATAPPQDMRFLPGWWEADLILGGGHRPAVGWLVCRKTLFILLFRLGGATAAEVLADYQRGGASRPRVCFASAGDAQPPGIRENTLSLIRQYLPDGSPPAAFSQRKLDEIARSLNSRPRKSLGFRTPAEVFQEAHGGADGASWAC